MSTWTTPATWANGAVTASQMNTEIRDHLNFLKGALDLLTGTTTADTGTAMLLQLIRATAAADILNGKVSGDANPRVAIDADGAIHWGPGSAASDTDLSRTASNELTMSGTMRMNGIELTGLTNVLNISNGYAQLTERASDPAAPPSNQVSIYARDNGAGKTQVVARFNTGAVVVIATQP